MLAGLFIPPRCAACGRPCAAAASVCAACERELEAARPGLAAVAGVGPVVWASAYEGVARELVAALKFGRRLGLADVAAERIVAALEPDLDCASVVAVPPEPLRLRRRGFDPAQLIAGRVANRLGVPLAAVLRRRSGRRQVGRRRSERVSSPPLVRSTGVPRYPALLVDDVLTTGATLQACATALRAAGCGDVRAAVFARALGAGAIRA